MAKKEALRIRAIELYKQGKSIASISKELGQSRQWVYKWIDRYNTKGKDWFVSESCTPHCKPNKTSLNIELEVIRMRHQLKESPYLESGAYAIFHKLQNEGIKAPSVATINRILKQHNLTNKKVRFKKQGLDYPVDPINMQMMDLIGPRYIRGGHRYYLLTIISNETRHAGVYPILAKTGENITHSIIQFWKDYSIPDFIQMDNELSFKGSNRYPRGLGQFLRTALSLNVTPIFIPISEPWRNGVIERFNQKVERTLLQQEHKSFEDLLLHAHEFVKIHNTYHHYSTLEHKTPLELDNEYVWLLQALPHDYQISKRPALDDNNLNEIHFVRLVRSDLIVNILNTEIEVKPELMHTYIEANLLINQHRLLIKQDNKIVQQFEFIMPLC